MDFVLSCLQEEKVAYPSGLEEMLKDFLGDGKTLLLGLWFFANSLCIKYYFFYFLLHCLMLILETKAFVLNLWKFLAVSVTKEKNSAIYVSIL